VTEILDRLTGIAIVREKLTATGRTVDRLANAVLDHETRLVRLETTIFPPHTGNIQRSSKPLLPKKSSDGGFLPDQTRFPGTEQAVELPTVSG
jgi:hypothetical protein